MKKRIMSLVLALALSLGLCAGASAAEAASRSGVLGDGDELSWSIDGGVLSVTSDQDWTGNVFAACYNNKGRLAQVKVLTPDAPSAPVSAAVTWAKLFWTGETLAPKCEPTQARLAPDKVITQGVKSWYDLTNPHSVNYYVAPRFAQDCAYTLNGAEAELAAVQSAAAKRGAVTEFGLNSDGNIASVDCYDYTVCKVDGQVSFCYTGPDGVLVAEPVTEKVTGKVSAFSTKGELFINGIHYKATGLTVEGCGADVSENGFRNWGFLDEGALLNTYDFYLDKSGSICWVEQLTQEYPLRSCVLTAAQVQAGDAGASETLQAELWLLSGDPRTVTVSQLDGQAVTDPQAALAQLSAPAFYGAQQMADGTYALTKTSGEILAIPAGTSVSPAEDFTGGAVPCLASESTVFWVVGQLNGYEMRLRFNDLGDLPELKNASGFALLRTGTADEAQYVYLNVPDLSCAPIREYVFLADDSWRTDPDLYEDGVCNYHFVTCEGTLTTLRVSEEVQRAINTDSMRLDRFDQNTYAGRVCALTYTDQFRVAQAIEPVRGAADLVSMGDGVIATREGRWKYNEQTALVFVDLGWIDDPDDMTNTLGVREGRDLYRVNASGIIGNPDNFFDPGDVNSDPAGDAIYRSVRATVIPSAEDSTLAEYVYVVRELW